MLLQNLSVRSATLVASLPLALLASALGLSLFASPAAAQSDRASYCANLERELVLESQRRSQGGEALPELRQSLRELERDAVRIERQLERRDCYEQFFFSRTLRQSPNCRRLARQGQEIEGQRRRVQRRIQDIRSARGGDGGRRRQELINALARNGCGDVYAQQAQRTRQRGGWNPFSGIFGREGSGFGGGFGGGYYDNAPRQLAPETGIVADSTYRTMCVRTCDGFYFPVSYATLPSKFRVDENVCQSRCAAPVELFVYRNPGGEPEQMIRPGTGEPYSETDNAFRYRKEFVPGCSCSPELYDAEVVAGTKPANGAPGGGGALPPPIRTASGTRGAAPNIVPELTVPDAGGAPGDPSLGQTGTELPSLGEGPTALDPSDAIPSPVIVQ